MELLINLKKILTRYPIKSGITPAMLGLNESYRIGILGYVWPEPQSSAAGFRDFNLMEACQSFGWDIHLLSSAKPGPSYPELESLGIPLHSLELNSSSADALFRELRFDFLIFDRFVTEEQFGARLEIASPETVRIVDTQDLHVLRRTREKLVRAKKNSLAVQNCVTEMLQEDLWRELSSIYRSDLSFILSDYELDLLCHEFGVPAELLHYFPFAYPDAKPTKPFSERINFCFLGNFRHQPNYDSSFWLAQEIWPRIRAQIPDAELHIYGAYPPKEIMALDNLTQGIRVYGPVENHLAMLGQYRVNLAPLRFGAGIKGKISDAWFSGTPSVTTPIGAEGMQLSGNAWGGIVADSAENLAQAAVMLHQEQILWEQSQRVGQEILQKKFSKISLYPKLREALLNAKANLLQRRERNLVGNMLRYNLHRSTEYFSRWIETKEKLKCLSPNT